VRHTPLSLILNHQLAQASSIGTLSMSEASKRARIDDRQDTAGSGDARHVTSLQKVSQRPSKRYCMIFGKPRPRLISIVVPSVSDARRDATSENPASLVPSEKYDTCAASNRSLRATGETPGYFMIVRIDAAVSLHRGSSTTLRPTVRSRAM
jgi:hypothetical protein